MQVTVYNNSSSNNTVTKTLTQIKSVTAEFYEESTIIDPVILLDYDAALFASNYVYIPMFNRYYFIKNVDIYNGRQLRLQCHVDVLMSFNIRSLTGVIARNEKMYNLYYADGAFKILNYKQVVTKAFPNSFNSNSNLLLTVVG